MLPQYFNAGFPEQDHLLPALGLVALQTLSMCSRLLTGDSPTGCCSAALTPGAITSDNSTAEFKPPHHRIYSSPRAKAPRNLTPEKATSALDRSSTVDPDHALYDAPCTFRTAEDYFC